MTSRASILVPDPITGKTINKKKGCNKLVKDSP